MQGRRKAASPLGLPKGPEVHTAASLGPGPLSASGRRDTPGLQAELEGEAGLRVPRR